MSLNEQVSTENESQDGATPVNKQSPQEYFVLNAAKSMVEDLYLRYAESVTSAGDALGPQASWHVTGTVSSVDVDSRRLQSFCCLLPASVYTPTLSHPVFSTESVLVFVIICRTGTAVSQSTFRLLGASRCSPELPPVDVASIPNESTIIRV